MKDSDGFQKIFTFIYILNDEQNIDYPRKKAFCLLQTSEKILDPFYHYLDHYHHDHHHPDHRHDHHHPDHRHDQHQHVRDYHQHDQQHVQDYHHHYLVHLNQRQIFYNIKIIHSYHFGLFHIEPQPFLQ
jgi:hypothetical protein